jgi:probable O-glycosylation ligase (exosortase A-associated)
MITEALFLISYLILLPIAVMFPFAGALAYEWLQYMPPGAVYNADQFTNLSLIMGGIAIGLWAVRDRKEMPKPTWLFAIFVIYALWLQVTQAFSIVGPGGNLLWDRSWKMLAFTITLSMMCRTRQRIEAFIWVVCLSIGNFVVSGMIKTVLSGGGGNTVIGADGNILGERVSFAIAITTIIPLIRYLRDHQTIFPNGKWVKRGLDFLTVSCVLATVGTQARTGIVALGILGAFYFIKSKRKLMFGLMVPVLIGLMIAVAPAGYFDRMNTIGDAKESSSAGRIDSWMWGWNFALDHPITGGGYHSFLLHQTGTIDNPSYLEAHNIFFETLGDHGFPGLVLMLVLFLGMIVSSGAMSKRAKRLPELDWAVNLGTMLQLALWTFIAGSQFISDASQSMSYELVALSLAARGVVERRLALEPKSALSPLTGVPPAKMPQAPQRPALTPIPGGSRPAVAAVGRRT